MSKTIKRNVIRCKHCNDVIESKNQHDFRRCKCGRVAVDGGLEYAKRSFPSSPAEEHFEELMEYE
ncbi:hypothetical protein N0O92_19580 [Alkalihalobacillus sp. MEB130]|uniref:DUF7695 domain-containing protein n=1 Tax=Alkalihalobacillus sp. MEB130 TaxID=2976704 RepID=UPI0028DF71CF|nr:hypothetical protein [Alkalihalobacillus sp. MEB130]MDT8862414.1 hypothetical protein [Alkalihalobacillus sp. MEB130]